MISAQIREAIQALHHKQTPIRDISRILKISRNTVRSVIRGKPRGLSIRSDNEDLLDLAARLLPECKGNIVRLRELLADNHGQRVSYSTLTRLVREANLKEALPKRVGSYDFPPAEESQHDTSPHRLVLAGKPTTAQCAALLLAYSRRGFIQYYPSFTRLEARHFLSRAFRFMEGTTPRCTIDNTSVLVAHGSGPGAEIAPEIEAFGNIFGTRFVPHRVGDPDRKARVERLFAYVEGNFLAGRTFSDWHDLNLQALRWCTEVANRKIKRSLGMSPEAAYLMEKPHLLALPAYTPPVYQALARVVDSEGFVHVDSNRYSAPQRLIGKHVQVLKYWDQIQIVFKNETVAQHERIMDERDRRVIAPGHHQPRQRANAVNPSPHETALTGCSEVLDRFVAEIKKRSQGRAIRPLKRLLDLKRTYPREPFLAACGQALQFGLFDLARFERMILSLIAGEFFQIPDEEEDQ